MLNKGYALIWHITTPTNVWARDGCEAGPLALDRSSTLAFTDLAVFRTRADKRGRAHNWVFLICFFIFLTFIFVS